MKTKDRVQDKGIWELEDLEETVIRPNQWGQMAARVFKALSVTHKTLPPGCYSITKDNRDDSAVFMGKDIKMDEILRFKGGLTDNLLKEIDGFWSKGDVFGKHGFLHKRGYLLYGQQGTGKSSIVWQIAKDIIDRKGVVFVCGNPKFFSDGLKAFRQVEPERPIVCVFEDVDAIIKKYGDPEILALLDGDKQVNRVINIATTNYPERLDKRVVSRPRRFDRIYKILTPNKKVRKAFFTKKLNSKYKVKEWVDKTAGLSFAALAETLISVLCLGNDLDKTISTLRDLESKNPSSSDFGKSVGFNKSNDDDDDDDDDCEADEILGKILEDN